MAYWFNRKIDIPQHTEPMRTQNAEQIHNTQHSEQTLDKISLLAFAGFFFEHNTSMKLIFALGSHCAAHHTGVDQHITQWTIQYTTQLIHIRRHLLDNLDDKPTDETERAPMKNKISFSYCFFILTHWANPVSGPLHRLATAQNCTFQVPGTCTMPQQQTDQPCKIVLKLS